MVDKNVKKSKNDSETNVLKDLSEEILGSYNRVGSRLLGLLNAYTIIQRVNFTTVRSDEKMRELVEEMDERLEPDGIQTPQYFLSILFLDAISEMEIFLASVLKSVVYKNPEKVGAYKISLKEILDMGGVEVDVILSKAVDEKIHEITYKKPSEFIKEYCRMVSIDSSVLAEKWSVYVEAKARRDLGVHNNWKCNEIYLKKLKEAGVATDAKVGDNMIPGFYNYIDELTGVLHDIAHAIIGEVAKVHLNVDV